jgi:hypothetical protein
MQIFPSFNCILRIFLPRRRFVTETFCFGDVLLQETFCYGDVLLRRRFVWRRFVEETFCAETFCMCADNISFQEEKKYDNMSSDYIMISDNMVSYIIMLSCYRQCTVQ